MSSNKIGAAVKAHVDRLVDEIRAADGSWDESYRAELVRNRFSKFMHEPRIRDEAERVAMALNAEFNLNEEQAISVAWWEEMRDQRVADLIEQQDQCCSDIEAAKRELEAATEQKKSAQATIETEHSRLRNLAREIRKPYTHPLPFTPDRQRNLPLADGEEWRAAMLADVLADDAALKGIALEKLGNVNLGQYTELVQKYGMGDKPKKLTRKQWDRVEAIVQKWHESQGEADEDDDASGESDE